MDRTAQLRAVAQRVADGLPESVVEVVLTGSVSRGVADELSDVEMLVVSDELPSFGVCVAAVERAGLAHVDTWTPAATDQHRVAGLFEGVNVEQIWWSRAYANERVRSLAAGEIRDGRMLAADALVHGVALRGSELFERWQEQMRGYPPGLAEALIVESTWMWRAYSPSGLLTVARTGERVSLVERLVDDARRVARIVFALNGVWEPTMKRLAARTEPLAIKPRALAERLESVLFEPDPRVALSSMYELIAETLSLVPPEIDVVVPRSWVAEALEVLR